MEKNTTLFVGIITLLIGFGIGYSIDNDRMMNQSNDRSSGTHMMGKGMNMSDTMMHMNADLKGKTGDAFDQAFLVDMIIHHEGAIEMAQTALTNAQRQEIKDLASEIISAQDKEIIQMKEWQQVWFGQ